MISTLKHLHLIASCTDWLDPEHLDLANFDGQFERGQFLEKSCRVGENFSAHNFLLGRNSFYHCRTQMPNNVIIGRHSSINALSLIGAVSHNVNSLTTGMLDIDVEARDDIDAGEVLANINPTVIGCDVWVGANAVILQGCTIGHGACVAAGAVVTKSVPPYLIVGGVPAKEIRYRFDQETRNLLLESRWWELPQELVTRLPQRDIPTAVKMAKTFWSQGRK